MKSGLVDRDTLVAFASGRLSAEESRRVLSSVENDPRLSAELEEILLLIRATEDENTARSHTASGTSLLEPVVAYVLRFAAVLIVVFLSVVAASELSKNRFCDLARVDVGDLALTWRGESDHQVEMARMLFIQGDREGSAMMLEQYVRSHPTDESAAVVHWLIGALLLESSRRDVLGLFPHFESERVIRALDHLSLAARTANPRLKEETCVLRMKAYLMLQQPLEALQAGEDYLKSGSGAQDSVLGLSREIHKR